MIPHFTKVCITFVNAIYNISKENVLAQDERLANPGSLKPEPRAPEGADTPLTIDKKNSFANLLILL